MCSGSVSRRRSGTGAGVPARLDFQALQNRRMAAADMFARGKRRVGVVDKLGVSAQTASRWHRIFLAEGKKGPAGAAGRAVPCCVTVASAPQIQRWFRRREQQRFSNGRRGSLARHSHTYGLDHNPKPVR